MHGQNPGNDAPARLNSELIEDSLNRNHSWCRAVFWCFGLSLCITVDILQYSMPLAFLPSVLEDRGHAPMHIATTIGVYYWTGFAGGLIITSYMIYRVLYSKEGSEDVILASTTRRQVAYLWFGLLVGTITLSCQSIWPTYWCHLICRFIQGFAGAFIFFYAFLLSVQLFKGEQQVFAMTSASIALNVAEVLGSFAGAIIYDRFGQRAVFWTLAAVSVMNQAMLMIIYFQIHGRSVNPSQSPSPAVSSRSPRTSAAPGQKGWKKLCLLLRSPRLACAVILIFMSAIIKGSVEEMLPFHAMHQWDMEPLAIGQLFSVVALVYIIAAALTGKMWGYIARFRILFCAVWLTALGISSWMCFAVHWYWRSETVLMVVLGFYGACLGLTHTPAALLLADAVEHEDEMPCKDAVNGIWNTMWEAGGSMGFLLGGLLAEHYAEKLELTLSYAVMALLSSVLLLVVGSAREGKSWTPGNSLLSTPMQSHVLSPREQDMVKGYGAT